MNTTIWQPEFQMNGHDANPTAIDLCFFAAPPEKLGRLLSCESSMRMSDAPISSLRFSIYVAILVLLFVGPLSYLQGAGFDWCIATAMVPIALIIVSLSTQFNHECSFIGTNGLAVFTISGPGSRVRRMHYLEFDHADALFVTYISGRDSGGQLEWRHGKSVKLRLDSMKAGFDLTRKSAQRERMIRGAEAAWTEFVKQRIASSSLCPTEFRFRHGGRILVAASHLAIEKQHLTREIPFSKIDSLLIRDGLIQIAPNDSKTFALIDDGRVKFFYGDLANVRAFLEILIVKCDFESTDVSRLMNSFKATRAKT